MTDPRILGTLPDTARGVVEKAACMRQGWEDHEDRAMRVTDTLDISERHISETFIRSAGPGGQNVNKVSSAVQLRFDVRGCEDLSESTKARLLRLAGARATTAGEIVIEASRFRSQDMNRDDARGRLVDLIIAALHRPKYRVPTRPSRGAKERRLEGKKKRSDVKAGRRGDW